MYSQHTTYIECEEIGKVVPVQIHRLYPTRIGSTFKLELQVIEGTVSLSIWEHSECFEGEQTILYRNRTLTVNTVTDIHEWSSKYRLLSAFHSEPNMRSDADIQHLWRQSVRSWRPRTMEQSSIAPERRWHIVQWIPAVAKDISVWIVGPWRSVNCINCAI